MIGYSGGGSDQSLYSHLINLDKDKFVPIVIYREDSNLVQNLRTNGILTVKQKFFASSFKKTKKKIIKIPGSKTLVYNFRALLESLIIVRTIIKYNIDIVHLNNSIKSNRAGALAGIILGKKVIVHDRMGFDLDIIDKFLLRFVNKIITISNEVKKTYQNEYYLENKISVIHNGIDTELFKPIEVKNRNNFVIGSVGRLVDWKGVDVLLKAVPIVLEHFPNCKFLIAGEGKEKENLLNLAIQLNIMDSVEFLGNVDSMVDLYNSMDIFVHTAIKPEPFGRVIIEAMACGLPVISTNIGGPKEIISDGNCGILIEPNNAKLLAEKINYLYSNSKHRKNMGQGAQSHVTNYFRIKDITKLIELLY